MKTIRVPVGVDTRQYVCLQSGVTVNILAMPLKNDNARCSPTSVLEMTRMLSRLPVGEEVGTEELSLTDCDKFIVAHWHPTSSLSRWLGMGTISDNQSIISWHQKFVVTTILARCALEALSRFIRQQPGTWDGSGDGYNLNRRQDWDMGIRSRYDERGQNNNRDKNLRYVSLYHAYVAAACLLVLLPPKNTCLCLLVP